MIRPSADTVRILSFDTSGPCLNLCLLEGDQVRWQSTLEPGGSRQQAAAMLLPSIAGALARAGWRKRDLSCLAVGRGPGSFTGVRTGLVTARTLAQGLQLPVVGVSTFECLAWLVERPVGIILSCNPGHLFAAAFVEGKGGDLAPACEPAHLPAAELAGRLYLSPRWMADREAARSLAGAVAAGELPPLSPLPELNNLAVVGAQIARDRLSLRPAEEFHWSRLEPLYLRAPSVTIKKDVDTHKPNDAV